jgi:hypothetical protein
MISSAGPQLERLVGVICGADIQSERVHVCELTYLSLKRKRRVEPPFSYVSRSNNVKKWCGHVCATYRTSSRSCEPISFINGRNNHEYL